MNRQKKTVAAAAFAVTLIGTMSAGAWAKEQSATELPVKAYDITLRGADESLVFPKGVTLQGQSLEGMSLEEVEAWIDDYVTTRQSRAVTLTVFGDNVFNYNAGSFGASWDNPEVVEELRSCVSGGNFVEQYKLQKDLERSPKEYELSFSIDTSKVEKVVSDLSETFYIAPVNASVTRQDGAFIVSPEITGKEFDADAITADLSAILSDFEETAAVEYDLPYMEVPAQYTSEDFAFSDTPLGSYATGNLGAAARVHNIQVSVNGSDTGAPGVNGTILYPGDEISALAMYGPQTTEAGYESAPGYENGRQVAAIGGGVCQTTTTLYNAVLMAELEVTQRSAHSMIVTYVPPALDAAVAEGSKDLKFRNNLSHPIYIQAYVSDGQLVVNIWGVEERPANRTIRYEYAVESCVFPSPLYQDVVDDIGCEYGSGSFVGRKISAPVEVHPEVRARSYKVVYIDGVETERTQLNYDYYEPMLGEMHHASDCTVYSEARPSGSGNAVYRYLGWDIYHAVHRLDGSNW